MKQATLRRLIFSLTASTVLCANAMADSRVFLLQLGSFESQAEAQTRWLKLKDKYPQLLEGLSVRTLDVTLPPDNFTVYRTQAGALESRSDAQIICDRLSSAGDECYVVETAMFQPSSAMQAAPAVVTPSITEPASAITAPIAAPSIVTADADVGFVAAAPSVQVDLSTPDLAATAPLEEESSFWDWINPFSSEDDAEQTASTEFSEIGMPQDTIELVDLDEPEPIAYDMTPQSAPMLPESRYQLPPPPAAPNTPVAINATPYQPNVTDTELSVNSGLRPAGTAQATASMPASIPFQVKRDGKLITPSSDFIPESGDVKVAEAIRVPVTDIQRVSPTPVPASKLRALGMPSEVSRQRNMWAEITYFNTQQEALAFWDQFRLSNPGFPPVRVRVTNPYLQTNEPRVSLRVGPFDKADMIHGICEQVDEHSNDHLSHCKIVRDLGGSSTAHSGPRDRGLAQRRMAAHRLQQESRSQMYWVQLGSFSSQAAARNMWATLMQRHEPLLNVMRPDISVPMQSSNAQGTFRLRTGPYPMRPAAVTMCRNLQLKGTKCAVVFSQ